MTIENIFDHYNDKEILKAADSVMAKHYLRGKAMTNPFVARQFCQRKLSGKQREHFLVICLDNKNRLLHHKVLFKGTIDQVSVYPREVVRYALLNNASALIVSHNHPSGDSTPSQADKNITRRLVDALDLLDMRLLDHLVVGADHITSMAEQGHL